MISEKTRQKLLVKSTSDLLTIKEIISDELSHREDEELNAIEKGII